MKPAQLNGEPEQHSATGDNSSAQSSSSQAASRSSVQGRTPEASLTNCWVVILMDPDYDDWSPWSVIAASKQDAVLKAQSDWRRWCGVPDDAEVVKVYGHSWMGEIA